MPCHRHILQSLMLLDNLHRPQLLSSFSNYRLDKKLCLHLCTYIDLNDPIIKPLINIKYHFYFYKKINTLTWNWRTLYIFWFYITIRLLFLIMVARLCIKVKCVSVQLRIFFIQQERVKVLVAILRQLVTRSSRAVIYLQWTTFIFPLKINI